MSDVLSKEQIAKIRALRSLDPGKVESFDRVALCDSHEALRAEVARLRADLEDSRDREHRLRSERDGNVWLWQGDEDDHPESLTCQVLIRPDDLRALLAARDSARAEGEP